MNIYSIKADGIYGGGMAVVSAPNTQRALEIATQIDDRLWQTDYAAGKVAMLTENIDIAEKILDHFETGE